MLSVLMKLVCWTKASPLMGLQTTIWGGLFGAVPGGSVYNVYGPTGALSSLLTMYAVSMGIGILPWLAIGSGLTSFLAYYARADRFCALISKPVMQGFSCGVAFTVASSQLPYGLGLVNMQKHVYLSHNIAEVVQNLGQAEPLQTMMSCGGLGLLLALDRWRPLVPWTALLAAVGILLGWLVDSDHVVRLMPRFVTRELEGAGGWRREVVFGGPKVDDCTLMSRHFLYARVHRVSPLVPSLLPETVIKMDHQTMCGLYVTH